MKKSREDRAEILTTFILSGFVVFLLTWLLSGIVETFLLALPTRFITLIFRSGMKLWTIKWIISLCIAVAIYGVGLRSELRIHRNMRRYWDKACTGFQWRRRFPDIPKSDIRSFLELFVRAFAFRSSQRLCFSPDDKVVEIYRILYPASIWPVPDVLELETLASLLNKKYGIDAATFWREDITLGELFTHTRVA